VAHRKAMWRADWIWTSMWLFCTRPNVIHHISCKHLSSESCQARVSRHFIGRHTQHHKSLLCTTPNQVRASLTKQSDAWRETTTNRTLFKHNITNESRHHDLFYRTNETYASHATLAKTPPQQLLLTNHKLTLNYTSNLDTHHENQAKQK